MSSVFSDEDLRPVASSVGLVEADLATTLKAWQDWLLTQAAQTRLDVTSTTVPGDATSALHRLNPLSTWGEKVLVVPTRDDRWTAWFRNTPSGTDPFSASPYLAHLLGTRTLALVEEPDWAEQFVLYAADGTVVRSVSATVQARWEFRTDGEPLPWEDTDTYGRRSVRDRFGPAQLTALCSGLGADIRDAGWWAPTGGCVLLERTGRMSGRREISGEERRRRSSDTR